MATFTFKVPTGGTLTDNSSPTITHLNEPATTEEYTLTSTNGKVFRHSQSIDNATHEELATGELASKGHIRFRNKDATNYVEIGIDVGSTFYPFLKIAAGKKTPFIPLSTAIYLYAQANTAPVDLDYEVVEA